jgi:hypothetical protein
MKYHCQPAIMITLLLAVCASLADTIIQGTDQVLPGEPAFIRLAHPIDADIERQVQISMPQRIGDLRATYYADRLGQWFIYKDRQEAVVEVWMIVFTPVVHSPLTLKVNTRTFDDRPEKEIVVQPGDARVAEGTRTFGDAEAAPLVAKALSDRPLVLSEGQHKALSEIAEKYADLSYGRMAKYILGAHEYNRLFDKHNNNGPPGCYAPCFVYFEDIIASPERDPIYLDALRRMAAAKYASSEYDAAREHLEELAASGLSKGFESKARKSLQELPAAIIQREEQLRKAQHPAPKDSGRLDNSEPAPDED